MTLRGERVLVTGAAGFIGSHLTERLLDEGAQVSAFVHYNSAGSCGWLEHLVGVDNVEIVAGDITDYASIRSAMDGARYVFHLAALIAIPYSYRAPVSYVNTNVGGTLNVLQAARELGTERIIHTSTSEVYGTASYTPIDEAHPQRGQSPYSASKIGADKLAEAYYCSFSLPVVTMRPFNTFGPRQSTRAVIPTIVTQCLNSPVIRLGQLWPTRDLNYVDNTIDGFILGATTPGCEGRTFNLGSGSEISIGELARKIAELMNVEIEITSEAERTRPQNSEVGQLLADHSQATQILGWQPKIDLDSGLEQTIAWIESSSAFRNPDRYTL